MPKCLQPTQPIEVTKRIGHFELVSQTPEIGLIQTKTETQLILPKKSQTGRARSAGKVKSSDSTLKVKSPPIIRAKSMEHRLDVEPIKLERAKSVDRKFHGEVRRKRRK